jgi:hypothetical protein
VALFGPSVENVFAPISRAALIGLLIESIRWHRANAPTGSDAVLNGCRALRFAADGTWSSRRHAGEWAIKRGHNPKVIVEALRARESGALLDRDSVQPFLRHAEAALNTVKPA